jgi:predicted SAM-dependent methyltransferase
MEIKKTTEGHALLNVGCGSHFFPEWNNLDLIRKGGVTHFDIRQPLPYPDDSFDATYSSHVLEHLPPDEGRRLLCEQFRVLKPGGTCRVVVPDMEGICRAYLQTLDAAWTRGDDAGLRDHRWMTLELLDQLVRSESGGLMRRTLADGDFNRDFVDGRMGEQFQDYYDRDPRAEETVTIRKVRKSVSRSIKQMFKEGDPRKTGEAHRWMYDRVSLRELSTGVGFAGFAVKTFDDSAIPEWSSCNPDRAEFSDRPRKPDSLFVECAKPGA